MTRPNPKPKIQNRIPIVSRLCPSMPKNWTLDRSGNFRLASPLTGSGCAKDADAPRGRNRNKVAANCAKRCDVDAILCKPRRMEFLRFDVHDDYAFRPILRA